MFSAKLSQQKLDLRTVLNATIKCLEQYRVFRKEVPVRAVMPVDTIRYRKPRFPPEILLPSLFNCDTFRQYLAFSCPPK